MKNNVAADLDYLCTDNDLVFQAFRVASALEDWLEDCEDIYAAVCVTRPTVSIHVGDCCVWDSEGTDVLTVAKCQQAYQKHVEILSAPLGS